MVPIIETVVRSERRGWAGPRGERLVVAHVIAAALVKAQRAMKWTELYIGVTPPHTRPGRRSARILRPRSVSKYVRAAAAV